jgi:hypothetical protein
MDVLGIQFWNLSAAQWPAIFLTNVLSAVLIALGHTDYYAYFYLISGLLSYAIAHFTVDAIPHLTSRALSSLISGYLAVLFVYVSYKRGLIFNNDKVFERRSKALPVIPDKLSSNSAFDINESVKMSGEESSREDTFSLFSPESIKVGRIAAYEGSLLMLKDLITTLQSSAITLLVTNLGHGQQFRLNLFGTVESNFGSNTGKIYLHIL